MRVERAVLAVAEVARRHDAEGADGGERANLRAAQSHVAVACPDALAFRAARHVKVAREHVPSVEAFTFAWIRQPAAAALVEFAAIVVAVARVISPTRIEVHRYLPPSAFAAAASADKSLPPSFGAATRLLRLTVGVSWAGATVGGPFRRRFANKRLQLHHLDAVWV